MRPKPALGGNQIFIVCTPGVGSAPEAVVQTAHKPQRLGATSASAALDPLGSFRGCPCNQRRHILLATAA
jgi:hypothetical protein